jgi:hypothetical protein
VVVANGIEVHFDPGRGELSLTCEAEAFDRIRRAVCAEAGFEAIAGRPPEEVRYIEVVGAPVAREVRPLRKAAVWLGCTVLGAALLLVVSVGVVAVVRWLLAHLP